MYLRFLVLVCSHFIDCLSLKNANTFENDYKLSDQQIALNQKNAWLELFQAVTDKSFELSIEYVCKLHSIAAKEEALEWCVFRKGKVYISGTDYEPPEHTRLESIFQAMIAEVEKY